MRRTLIHGLIALTLCTGSFVVGQHTTSAPEPESHGTAKAVPSLAPLAPEDAPWREAVEAARGTAQAGTLRAQALEILNTADSTAALADGLRLLGWTGTERDLGLLEAFVVSRDPELSPAAMGAVGRIGGPEALALLHAYTEDQTVWVRHGALSALGDTGDRSALAPLEEALQSQEDYYIAAHALSTYGGPSAAAILTRAFEARSDYTAHEMARALSGLTAVDGVRETLYRSARFGDAQHRQAAISALAQAHDPDLFELLEKLVESGIPTDRNAAIQALGQLADRRAVPLLMDIAHNGPAETQYMTVSALANSPSPRGRDALLDLAEKGPMSLAREAVNCLDPQDSESLSVLLWVSQNREQVLADAAAQRVYTYAWVDAPDEVVEMARTDLYAGSAQAWRVSNAVNLLIRHGAEDDRLDVYAWMMDAPNSVRTQAVHALANDPSGEADAVLFDFLDDPYQGVRNAAVQVLMNRGESARAILEDLLLDKLQQEEPDFAWNNIEYSLVQLDSRPAMQLMEQRVIEGTDPRWRASMDALLSGTPDQKKRLVHALDRIEEPTVQHEVFNRLLYDNVELKRVVDKALETGDPTLMSSAAHALARVGGTDAKRRLRRLMGHQEVTVRTAALTSLVSLGGEDVETLLLDALKDDALAATAVGQLANVGTPAARSALEDVALRHDNAALRQQAVNTLTYQPGPRSFDILSTALNDSETSVRQAALYGLQNLGTHQAAETIASALDGDEAEAMQAARILRSMGGRTASDHADEIKALLGQDNRGYGGYYAPGYYGGYGIQPAHGVEGEHYEFDW